MRWMIDILAKFTTVKDKAVIKAMVPAGIDPWAQMDLASMRSDFDWFLKRRLIVSDTVKFEDAIDTSFVDFAKKYLEAGH